jgi:hypothetical protein
MVLLPFLFYFVLFSFSSLVSSFGAVRGRIAIPILSAGTCARGDYPSSISSSGQFILFLFILVFNGITIGPESDPDLGPRALELSAEYALPSSTHRLQALAGTSTDAFELLCRLEFPSLTLPMSGPGCPIFARSSSCLTIFGVLLCSRTCHTHCVQPARFSFLP